MHETEDWYELRRRYEVFLATELGKLYCAYDKALVDYWRRDADYKVPLARLEELQQTSREATNAFVAKLMDLAGV